MFSAGAGFGAFCGHPDIAIAGCLVPFRKSVA
jgi:hypothetical protein